MSIYSHVDSGTSFHRSRYTKSISNVMTYDCQFHQLVPVLKRFCLPGDIWKIGGDVLVRFLPMRTPTLTPNTFRVRYFFVPLRLVEPNTELIITGSVNGKLFEPSEENPYPVFENLFARVTNSQYYTITKHSFWDYMNVQTGDYTNIKDSAFLPALYWQKGYLRIYWDFYRDENLSNAGDEGDFDSYLSYVLPRTGSRNLNYSMLSKDYFTSSLPWQLKAVSAPRIDVTGAGTWTPNYNAAWINGTNDAVNNTMGYVQVSATPQMFVNGNNINTQGVSPNDMNSYINGLLNQPQSVSIQNLGFTLDDLRTMAAQTRVFERLARAGSRYTEYLRSNFGTAPADDTLQRPQYLGGWKVPIVTTEVLQTAEDGTTPVGTMRGHGITRGGNRINTFICKEFGMLFGIAEIRPKVQYSTGVPRQLSYKSRWDFFNPSLQHLSEQEVRNGELFVNFTADGQGNYDNDNTFGFQAYANELRSYQDETVGDMRDGLSDWNQAIAFAQRPNLNSAFIEGYSHLGSFNRPFVYQGSDGYPIIVQFSNILDVYRPMVKYATPGLVDHL